MSLVILSKWDQEKIKFDPSLATLALVSFISSDTLQFRQDFLKFMLQIVTVRQKIPRSTCCLFYFNYSDSDHMWLVVSTWQPEQWDRSECDTYWPVGVNAICITFKLPLRLLCGASRWSIFNLMLSNLKKERQSFEARLSALKSRLIFSLPLDDNTEDRTLRGADGWKRMGFKQWHTVCASSFCAVLHTVVIYILKKCWVLKDGEEEMESNTLVCIHLFRRNWWKNVQIHQQLTAQCCDEMSSSPPAPLGFCWHSCDSQQHNIKS